MLLLLIFLLFIHLLSIIVNGIQQDNELIFKIKNLIENGDSKEALNIISSIDENPLSFDIQLLLSRALVNINRVNDAEKILVDVINESNDEIILNDAKILLGKLYVYIRQYSNAEDILLPLYNNVLNILHPLQKSQLLSLLAKISINKYEDANKARIYLESASSYNPNDPSIRFELGMIYLYIGLVDLAITEFNKSEEYNPKFDYKLLGKVYLHYKHFKLASVQFDKAIDNSTTYDPETALYLAEISEILNDSDKALRLYSKVLELYPHNAIAHAGLGFLLLGIGSRNFGAIYACGNERHSSAVQHLKLAYQLDPNIQRVKEALEFCDEERNQIDYWNEITSYLNTNRSDIKKPSNNITKLKSSNVLIQFIQSIKISIFSFISKILNSLGIKSFDFQSSSNNNNNINAIKKSVDSKINDMKDNWNKRSNSIESISAIANITSYELLNNYILQNKPIIIKGLFDYANHNSLFTIPNLQESFGNERVRVSVSQSGRFDGPENGLLWNLKSNVDVLVRPPTTSMLLSDYFKLLNNNISETFYIEYCSLHQYLGNSGMNNYIKIPDVISNSELDHLVTNIWIGGHPTTSPLHYDDYENFLYQIKGEKELILFPPSDLPNLYYISRPKGTLQYSYPNNFTRDVSTISKNNVIFGSSINIDDPDTKKYPLYKEANPYRVVLQAGDVLYLPVYWHHEVQSIPDHLDKLNIAVNFWFANKTYPINEANMLQRSK